MKKTVCNEGIVRKIDGENVTVEITVRSACSNCHAKSLCSTYDRKQNLIHAISLTPENIAVGEKVTVSMQQSMGNKAVVIGYFLPLVVLLVSLILSYKISKNELLSFFITLGATGLYFFFVWLFRKKIEKQFIFYVHKIEEDL
ncbi:MAG TPA: SoxR reducing system RseC family protein [Bacteroidales bacterium]|jgi:sigma-E factor negative regulatory protein RseC|nr:SoxR reducing system RseC family protein [Bacteroidales bacterium]HQA86366.1 SoxR reducing system RseC family protein [Bacteroidales bacterium]